MTVVRLMMLMKETNITIRTSKEKDMKEMKKYNEMSCGELRRQLNQIDNDLRRFPGMSQLEKDRLTYERMNINGVLLRKLAAILDECDEKV